MPATKFDAAFPSALRSDCKTAASALKLSFDIVYGHFPVNVLGEALLIPSRVLSPSTKPELPELSLRQRQMAQCILTRSTDGFERQTALKVVLPINEPWSVAYVIALTGEYVVEIIDDVYASVPQLNREVVATFIEENPAFYQLTRDRVMSYWNCYHRWQVQRGDYVGFKLLRELDAMVESQRQHHGLAAGTKSSR